MAANTRDNTRRSPQRSSPPPSARPPLVQPSNRRSQRPTGPQRRWMPDDALFETSYVRLNDAASTPADLRFAALAPLPTPVDAQKCTNMWIPAKRLSNEHGINEIMESLASNDQPATWQDCLVHLRDFTLFPGRGISFVCASDTALTRLGNLQLTICGTPVTIKKYSKFDKLYYVDLRRLPPNVTDQVIYDWFCDHQAPPILIAPTHVYGQVRSRARTVYFNAIACPDGLISPDGEALREISLDPADKPCFVHHKDRKYNKVTPPSLRTPSTLTPRARRESEGSDASMDTAGEGSTTGPSGVSHTGSLPGSTPQASTVTDPVRATRPTTVRSRAAESQVKRMILGTTKQDDPDWMLVHHSQYGVINRGGGKYLEPAGLHACELAAEETDPHALTYDIPVSPNQYDILQDEGFDETLPPDVDIEAKYIDDNEMSEFVAGYTVESDLLPLAEEVRSLKEVRKLPLTVEQVSVEELQAAIDAFLEKEVLKFTSHDDTLAAIQVQPAYFRRIFHLPKETQYQLFKAHAIHRAVCATPLVGDESADAMSRIQMRCNLDPTSIETVFARLFPEPDQPTALKCAVVDLFLMIFAPSIYIDPVKVQALIPDHLPPSRIRNTAFLLWSDVVLSALARTDMASIYTEDTRTPPYVISALNTLADATLPPPQAEAGPSSWIRPQL